MSLVCYLFGVTWIVIITWWLLFIHTAECKPFGWGATNWFDVQGKIWYAASHVQAWSPSILGWDDYIHWDYQMLFFVWIPNYLRSDPLRALVSDTGPVINDAFFSLYKHYLVGGEWLPSIFNFPRHIGNNHPNWRSHIFSRGVAKNHQPVVFNWQMICNSWRSNCHVRSMSDCQRVHLYNTSGATVPPSGFFTWFWNHI